MKYGFLEIILFQIKFTYQSILKKCDHLAHLERFSIGVSPDFRSYPTETDTALKF